MSMTHHLLVGSCVGGMGNENRLFVGRAAPQGVEHKPTERAQEIQGNVLKLLLQTMWIY
jgi:hypothetical protein